MLQIALTGGISKGKSTILQIISSYGVSVLSADDVAREVINREDIQKIIAKKLDISFPLSRTELRDKIIESSEAKEYLDNLLHPIILKEIVAINATVTEVPLLFEAGYENHFKRIWLATCNDDTQLQRLTDRLGDRSTAEKLIKIQMPDNKKINRCDRLIETDVSTEILKEKIQEILLEDGLIR